MGAPTSNSGDRMLLCNFRARPMAPFVGEISRDSHQKGGGLVMRTGALDGNTASAGCQPVRIVRQPTGPPSPTGEAAARCPWAELVNPQIGGRSTPPEIGEAQALLMISGPRSLASRREVRWRSISSRDGARPTWARALLGRQHCGSLRRLLALILWGLGEVRGASTKGAVARVGCTLRGWIAIQSESMRRTGNVASVLFFALR